MPRADSFRVGTKQQPLKIHTAGLGKNIVTAESAINEIKIPPAVDSADADQQCL